MFIYKTKFKSVKKQAIFSIRINQKCLAVVLFVIRKNLDLDLDLGNISSLRCYVGWVQGYVPNSPLIREGVHR